MLHVTQILSVWFLRRDRQSEDYSGFGGAETQRTDSGASWASGRQGCGESWRRRNETPQRSRKSRGSAEGPQESVSRGSQILLTASSGSSNHSHSHTQCVLPVVSQSQSLTSLWMFVSPAYAEVNLFL